MPLTSFNNSDEFQNFPDWDFEHDRYQGCPAGASSARYYRHDQFLPSTRAIANNTNYNDLGFNHELWDEELREEMSPFKFNFS